MSASNTIFDALDVFDATYQRGKNLKAIIITENGGADEHPIGIITTIEIPRLISLVHPKPIAPIKPRH